MLAHQSTSVLRKVIELFLADYTAVCLEGSKVESDNLAAAAQVAGHQAEIIRDMPPAALADLFLRAKRAETTAKPDDQMVKDLLEIS